MKKILLLLLLGLLGVATWYYFETRKKPKDETPRQQPFAVSQHTEAFNLGMDSFLNAYYALSESLVKWDSAAVETDAVMVGGRLNNIPFRDLQKDSMIYETAISYVEILKNDLGGINENESLAARRQSFHSFSQNLYDLLRTVKYDNQKVYLQECPMAFNDDQPGIWISNKPEIRNPYLGLHHPKYKSGMLECGETRDSINFATFQ